MVGATSTREKVLIGGGKERMATLLTPEFVADDGLPTDADAAQRGLVAAVAPAQDRASTPRWSRRAPCPPGPASPGSSSEAAAAGWQLAVASTSAEPSVRAVLEHAVGDRRCAERFAVFAGDVVPRKKPAPDIYLLAVDELGRRTGAGVVVEDSRNGLRAALGAGLTCLVTVEQLHRATRTSPAPRWWCPSWATRTRPARHAEVLADPHGVPTRPVRRARGPASAVCCERRVSARRQRAGETMSSSTDSDLEYVVRTIAQTAVDNEKEFGDLDAVVGDGDFGYSLARGFEIVVADWDTYDRSDIGDLPEEDRPGRSPAADRRHVGSDLGHRVPAGGRAP